MLETPFALLISNI